MSESDFWLNLERRVNIELMGMADIHYRGLSCDGFIPRRWHLEVLPRITGKVWMFVGSKMAEWDFVLYLRPGVRKFDDLDWESHLPPEDTTRWLSADPRHQTLKLYPEEAAPDPA